MSETIESKSYPQRLISESDYLKYCASGYEGSIPATEFDYENICPLIDTKKPCDPDPVTQEDIPEEFLIRFWYVAGPGNIVLACRDVRSIKEIIERAKWAGKTPVDPVSNTPYTYNLIEIVDAHPFSKTFDTAGLRKQLEEDATIEKKKAIELNRQAALDIERKLLEEDNKDVGYDPNVMVNDLIAELNSTSQQARQLAELIRVKSRLLDYLAEDQRSDVLTEIYLAREQQAALANRVATVSLTLENMGL